MPDDPVARAAQMEQRLQQLEATNASLLRAVESLNQRLESQKSPASPVPSGLGGIAPVPGTALFPDEPPPFGDSANGGENQGGERRGIDKKEGEAEEGREPYKPDMEPTRHPLSMSFAEGLTFRTPDNYFTMTFHNLSQLDYRGFNPTGDPLHDNFVVPRQRWYFQGNASPYANYYTVINRGYGSLDLLDSWVDFNFWPEYKNYLQFRVGRMKTPYTYEYIKISESDLIAPERSLFVGNLAGNRQIGAMAHGRLFNRTVEYYAGVFNGPRRSFEDFNSGKDLFFFLNTKPFLHSDWDLLRQVNLGGSFNFGDQRNPLSPNTLRTASDQSNSNGVDTVSPAFLSFKPGVFENGMRMEWSGDLAYYWKNFGLLAGYQGGFQNYSISKGTPPGAQELSLGLNEFLGVNSQFQTRIPMTGWSVAAFWFVTGEEITRRVYLLQPRRPFGWNDGHFDFGPGAIELYGRFANLHMSSRIFSQGLVDPANWTNNANTIDTGINWYLNNYIKLTFDYQYSMFGSPVFLSPTSKTDHMNLFWFRTQIFF